MAYEGDQGVMANTLFPIYQRQTGVNVGGGINGSVPFMSIPSVPMQELDAGLYVPLSHNNTHDDPYELMNCAQSHVKNRKPSDVTDDGETELQGLVSNILDEADSQENFYSDGSQHNNNIWSPKILRDELLQYFQCDPRTQYNSNFAPNYTSHDAFGKAHGQAASKEAEELCQASANGFSTNQQLPFNFPNGVRDMFSAQHGPHKPPPGLPLPPNMTGPYMMASQQNNYGNIPVSKERGNGEPLSSFPDLNRAFRPQCEMNGADLFYEDHYNQGVDKPATNEQFTSQDLNPLVNSFQSLVAVEDDSSEFPNVSMQHEDNTDNTWRSPSPFMRARGNHSAQMQRQMGTDFVSVPREQNGATRKQLFKPDALQDLPAFSLQTAHYSPQAKVSLGHQNKMLLQRDSACLPLNVSQFSRHPIQQSSKVKFKTQTHEKKRMAGFFGDGFNARALSGEILPEEKRPALSQNSFYDLPASIRPPRFNRDINVSGIASSQQFIPFMYGGNDPRRHPGQLQSAAFKPRPSLGYRGGVPSVDVGDMMSANDMSGFISVMRHGGENTYHGMSLTPPVQMNQGGPVFQLFIHLDECYDQWRSLERERKRTEIVLSKTFLGKRTTAPLHSSLPKTPPNPSKVDHLIVNQMREQARVSSLLDKMECLSGVPINSNIYTALSKHHMAICVTSARRREEITNMSHSQHQRAAFTEDKVSDTLLLVVALKDLAATTRKLRTAVWCALQMTLPKPAPRPEPPVSEEKPDETSLALCDGYSYRL